MLIFEKYKKHILLVLILILSVVSYQLVRYGDFLGAVQRYRDLYKEAMNYQTNGNFKQAYNTYAKISPRYNGYDAVLFHQAKCASELSDEKTSIENLQKLSQSSSLLAARAAYSLGQAYVRIKSYQDAENQFNFVIRQFPDTEYAVGSYYYLGSINKTANPKKALRYWSHYIKLSPDGRFSQDCVSEILSLKLPLETKDKLNLAVVLYQAQKYNKALEYLRQVPMKDSWFYIANSYKNLGNYDLARKIYKEGLTKYSWVISDDNLYEAMFSYANLLPDTDLKKWSEVIKTNNRAVDFALYHKAQLLPADKAKPIYKIIMNKYPQGNFASEALWHLFWSEFEDNNYISAIELGQRHFNLYSNRKANPKMLFWMGKLCERINKKQDAIVYYNAVINRHPDSYYAFRANGRREALLTGYDPGWTTAKTCNLTELKNKLQIPYTEDELKLKYGESALELLNTRDFDLLATLSEKDKFIDSWVKFAQGIKSKSIVVARDSIQKMDKKPSINDSRWKLVYPLYFTEEIEEYASINNIDPLILLSLIREESYFNQLAVSSSNARGLMQLLPGTANDIAKWKKLGSVNEFSLFSPRSNIKLGSAYLKYVKSKLNNEMLFAIAAYNGGPAAVERWTKRFSTEDLDEFVENIPYDQTRDYVKKVYGSYWNYKRIYKID